MSLSYVQVSPWYQMGVSLLLKRCLLGTYSVDFDIKNDRLGYVAQNGRYDDILKRDDYALWLLERFCSRQSVGVQPSRALNMR